MNRSAQRRKSLIRWALAAMLAVDAVLAAVNWRPAPSAQEQKRELEQRQRLRDLLAADVRRAEGIRQQLPDVQRAGDKFFTEQLGEATTGYSSVVADLGGIARKAGLDMSSLTFKQREVASRGVVEIDVAGTVEGDYPNLLNFLSGLEHSDNFYLLDSQIGR